jgi:hypothetical protein
LVIVLTPSAEHEAGVLKIVGTAGSPVAATFTNDALAKDVQLPLFAVKV